MGGCHDKKFYLDFSLMLKKIQNSVGARATVLKKLIHPKKVIGDRYSNIGLQERLNDMVVVRKGTKPIKLNPKTVIFFIMTIYQTIPLTYKKGVTRC